MAQIDLKKATFRIKDNDGNVLEVICGEGNLTWDEKKPRKYVRSWGKLHTVVDADEEALDVKFEFLWDFLLGATLPSDPQTEPEEGYYQTSGWVVDGSVDNFNNTFIWDNGIRWFSNGDVIILFYKQQTPSAPPLVAFGNSAIGPLFQAESEYPEAVQSIPNTENWMCVSGCGSGTLTTTGSITWVSTKGTPTVEDCLKQRGFASSWISTSPDPCQPYCVDLEIEYDPACPGVEKEIIVLSQFRYEQLTHDFRAGMITCSGKCNAKEAIITRE